MMFSLSFCFTVLLLVGCGTAIEKIQDIYVFPGESVELPCSIIQKKDVDTIVGWRRNKHEIISVGNVIIPPNAQNDFTLKDNFTLVVSNFTPALNANYTCFSIEASLDNYITYSVSCSDELREINENEIPLRREKRMQHGNDVIMSGAEISKISAGCIALIIAVVTWNY